MNPTDIVEFNPVNTYTVGAQIGKTAMQVASGSTSCMAIRMARWTTKTTIDEDGELVTSAGTLFQADVTLGYNLSGTFYLGVNASYQTGIDGRRIHGPGQIADR